MTSTIISPTTRQPGLAGQAGLIICGSAGVGLETAGRAHAEGADVVLTGRNSERLDRAARELEPLSTAAFDATDPAAVQMFFEHLDTPVDHIMVTAGGSYYAPLADLDFAAARRIFEEKLWLALAVARHAGHTVRAGGSVLFMGGTAPRRSATGTRVVSASVAALATAGRRW